jgi:hypothetical protein
MKVELTNALDKRLLLSQLCKRIRETSTRLAIAIVFVLAACSARQAEDSRKNSGTSQTATDWKTIEQALGKAGSMQPGEVYKVSLPRSDLKVTVGGVELKPALALGSWLAFNLFFMHFRANDDALKLARGLRSALDQINVTKSQPK